MDIWDTPGCWSGAPKASDFLDYTDTDVAIMVYSIDKESFFDAMNDVVKHMPNCAKLDSAKGQLISKCPFGVFKSPPKTSKFVYGFLP